jgi:hypothetical protein
LRIWLKLAHLIAVKRLLLVDDTQADHHRQTALLRPNPDSKF